ncbi:ABC transporter substrate-binding protein [Robiginitalea sp. M366]|uniref:ABC transporter substrate-binding protein n=1 Tax=Robiginitalea aestuariiviva TaxID=3036903 RepID=UPI00240D64BE|nr:ABC transporter substrate-binding protein [Robiginitalea aestuariiviva]MDG1573491.1 ABC transporter substrate-binding protein [Robiginitalea aestuariiviva]
MAYRFFLVLLLLTACRGGNPSPPGADGSGPLPVSLDYARGFAASRQPGGWVLLTVNEPWPGAGRAYHYALVPDSVSRATLPGADTLDGVIPTPVRRIVLTSTTHIPALETLEAASTLVGFPGLDYISSPQTLDRIARGEVAELGANEQLNTERVLETGPDLVVGFGVSDAPRAYRGIQQAGIPVIFNGDWTEQSPLGKAEWIKFFGLLLEKSRAAEIAFATIEKEYLQARALARTAPEKPRVLSGALYRDVWYLPAGESWAARFLEDAHANYLWADHPGTGSLSLSLEAVLERADQATAWVSPSQFTSYTEMREAQALYARIPAFQDRAVFTYAATRGPGGGLLYFELGPARPDLVLKDLIHYLHPGLLADYKPVFFKPLDP